MRSGQSAMPYGVIPAAVAATHYESPYDTSNVIGGNAEDRLLARLENGSPASISAPRSGRFAGHDHEDEGGSAVSGG